MNVPPSSPPIRKTTSKDDAKTPPPSSNLANSDPLFRVRESATTSDRRGNRPYTPLPISRRLSAVPLPDLLQSKRQRLGIPQMIASNSIEVAPRKVKAAATTVRNAGPHIEITGTTRRDGSIARTSVWRMGMTTRPNNRQDPMDTGENSRWIRCESTSGPNEGPIAGQRTVPTGEHQSGPTCPVTEAPLNSDKIHIRPCSERDNVGVQEAKRLPPWTGGTKQVNAPTKRPANHIENSIDKYRRGICRARSRPSDSDVDVDKEAGPLRLLQPLLYPV
ncbi:hypothetical protein C8J57DRAFT_1474107 [Mycena rebaudengoi]|nr:hypothetical protein C8J57DRAFT_1474107 [Mycena rebaudengoi]